MADETPELHLWGDNDKAGVAGGCHLGIFFLFIQEFRTDVYNCSGKACIHVMASIHRLTMARSYYP